MTNAIPVDLMKVIYGKALTIGQRSLRTSKFRSMGLKKTHFNEAEYAECRYLEGICSASSADSHLMGLLPDCDQSQRRQTERSYL